ncbi:uncharacterized protein LOC131618089 isoform X1 [Vicia villosa]|uniref:uncharacterized protein LOC131618089 isoform X1 n=1 Tax=Vicia villosa TaxID=3911 RepID=UPI00273C44FB|nr:uncharacterized protein LOC131618089 isoform X1 [Vicia villosa]
MGYMVRKIQAFFVISNSRIVSINSMAETEPKPKGSLSENDVKSPNILERAKEEIKAVFKDDKSPRHHKETHGRNDDIDERTSVEEVKAPSVFGRMKEEIEAVVEAIHPKKESDTKDSPSK